MLGANQELIMRYSHQALGLVAVASALLVAGYVWRHRRAAAARLSLTGRGAASVRWTCGGAARERIGGERGRDGS